MAATAHPAFEEYCEAIFELREDAIDVVQARLAERLRVSRPAVSEMVGRLRAAGMVNVDDRSVRLTPNGAALAEQVVRRHRLAERFLTDVLELPWAEAHEEAGRWEHVLSPRVEAALDRYLHHPTTCPHGNPIPGSGHVAGDTAVVADLATGDSFTVVRIPEELEWTDGMLEYLEHAALEPGRHGEVVSVSPDGTVTVRGPHGMVGLSAFVARRIIVEAPKRPRSTHRTRRTGAA
jgi:DtxR family Mn-dependent transcriptional regulator